MFFGIYMRELINLVLAREEGKTKLLYPSVYPGCQESPMAAMYLSDNVYATVPEILVLVILGCIFDKMTPIMKAAEKLWLKAGQVAHCGLLKTRLGLYALGLIPKPDLISGMDIACDMGSKNSDLIHEYFGIRSHTIGVCQDRKNREFPEIERGAEFLVKGLKRYHQKVEDVVGFEIPDEVLLKVVQNRGGAGYHLTKIMSLVEKSDPLVLNATHESIIFGVFQLPLSRDSMEAAIEAGNILYEELKDRVNKGIGVVEKGAPRVIGILPSSCSYPDLEHLMAEVGIALGVTEFSLAESDAIRHEDLDQVKDPYRIMAYGIFRAPFCNSVRGRNAHIIERCKRTGVNGVLNRLNIGCRTTLGEAPLIKDALTKELGIPVLMLEVECWDARHFDVERTRRKLELFRDIMKSKRVVQEVK